MTARCVLVLIALVAAACSSAPPERQIVDDAATALGGADRIQALAALEVTGSGPAPNAGQNRLPDDELPVWQVSEHTRSIDLANNRTRVRQLREAQFQFAGATVQRVTQGLDGDVAYNVAPDGTMTRAGDAAARDRRVELLHHPVTIVRAALDPAAKLANPRTEGGEQLVDITTAKGDALTLAIDQSTNLPSRVRSMSANANMGDVAIVTTFSDYEDVDGVKLPRKLTTMMDKYLQFDLQVAKNTVGGNVADLAATTSVTSAPAPTPPPVAVTVEEVAKGIWWLAGSGNHRSIVFEFDDHLVLYEAPVNEARSKAVIDKARTLSSKPLTKAIISHHHFDHSGGLRVAVAEGLTIVTHRANEAFFKDLLARQHTIVPDALQQNPKPAMFEFVDDQMTLKDKSMEVQLYHLLDNPREGTNLYAYVPRERMLVQADLYDASWQQHLWGENVLTNLAQRKLRIDRDVPVHGVIEPFDQMVKTIKAKPTIAGTN
ncbi:MAG TPA: MBL fold metallo-hydrolase [Vicinamibacterales bacterium]|nr:MBL fold metallo-hydrolase [Vicinamibacterales bacterium]